jgi:cell division septation protein DedD
MKHVITALSKALDIPWVGIWGADPMARVPKTGRAILVNWHGTFPKQLWDDTDAGFVNVIRDPRDILLSGCQYHHYAGPAGEGFLHVPRADLGGLTYQQTLQNMQSLSAKLLFEMNEKHAQTLREMLAWPSDHPRQSRVKYETLMGDVQGDAFVQALTPWGLSADEAEMARLIFIQHSLFNRNGGTITRKSHVQSGKTTRWRDELPIPVAGIYAAECQATFDVLKSSKANNGSDTYIYNSYGTNSSVDSAASTAAAVLLFGIAGLIIAEGSVVQTYKNCMKRVTGNGNVTPLRASGTPTSGNAGVAASTVGAPKAKPQSGGSPMIATNPRPVLNGSGKVAPAKSAAAPATAPAKIENTTETQSGYTSPQTAPVSTGVNPECPAGASLFTGGAGLCPQ